MEIWDSRGVRGKTGHRDMQDEGIGHHGRGGGVQTDRDLGWPGGAAMVQGSGSRVVGFGTREGREGAAAEEEERHEVSPRWEMARQTILVRRLLDSDRSFMLYF
jgi:hypothetical protein